MAWEGLSFRRASAFDISATLSNLEKMMRDKLKMNALDTIRSYSRSKHTASTILKRRAMKDVESILT